MSTLKTIKNFFQATVCTRYLNCPLTIVSDDNNQAYINLSIILNVGNELSVQACSPEEIADRAASALSLLAGHFQDKNSFLGIEMLHAIIDSVTQDIDDIKTIVNAFYEATKTNKNIGEAA